MNDASIALSLLLVTFGCGSDGGGSNDAASGETSTTGERTDGSSGTDATTGAVDSSSEDGSSSGTDDADDAGDTEATSTGVIGTCGGIECGPEEQCVEDVCVPTPTCEAPVVPSHPDCSACIARQCCEVVQACYGDGSARQPTPCADLSLCVDAMCAESETLEEFELCAFDGCGATQDDYDALLATFGCVGECVAQVGLGREESCGVTPR